MAVKKPDESVYVEILQNQVNTDIEAVKIGSMDEELLRKKLQTCPDGPETAFILWLGCLSLGMIDGLEATVEDQDGVPVYICLPIWESARNPRTPIIHLHPIGPTRQESVIPVQVPLEQTQLAEA